MNSMKIWVFVLVMCLWPSLHCRAVGTPDSELVLPASYLHPPATGVMDTAGFFNRNLEVSQRISARIQKLKQDCGYQLYLVVEPVLLTSSAPEMAALLREAWLPDGNGMVLVYESAGRKLGVGRDLTLSPTQEKLAEVLPSNQVNLILDRVMTGVESNSNPERYLEVVVDKLAKELEVYFISSQVPPSPQRLVKLGLLIAGGLALLGLVGIAIGALIGYSSMTRSPRFRFPEVEVVERLGAPCGSRVSARRFSLR